MGKVVISYSSYACYKQCPFQYKLSRIDRIKQKPVNTSFTVPGLIVHKAAESYLKTGDLGFFNHQSLETSLHQYQDENESVNLQESYGSFNKALSTTQRAADNLSSFLLAREVRSSKRLVENWFGTWDKPLELAEGIYVQGASDLIVINQNNTATLFDYKVAWNTKNLNPAQLLLYKMASEKLYDFKITMSGFYLLPIGVTKFYSFTENDEEKLIKEFREMLANISSGNLPARVNPKCKYCEYRGNYCKEEMNIKNTKKSSQSVGYFGINSVEL